MIAPPPAPNPSNDPSVGQAPSPSWDAPVLDYADLEGLASFFPHPPSAGLLSEPATSEPATSEPASSEIATSAAPQAGAGSLRQFQAHLSTALAASRDLSMLVALRANGHGWLINASDIAEAMVSPAIARIGRQSHGVRGIVATRGRVSTVLDMPIVLAPAPVLSSVPISSRRGPMSHPESLPPTGWLTLVAPHRAQGLALWWPDLIGMVALSDLVLANEYLPALAEDGYRDASGVLWWKLNMPALLRTLQSPSTDLSGAMVSALAGSPPPIDPAMLHASPSM